MPANADAGRVLEPFRKYLRLLATVRLAPRQARSLRCSATDDAPGLRRDRAPAGARAAVAARLRKVLARTLADAVRDLERARRDVDRERSIQRAMDESASGLEAWLAADQSSPSERADKNEQLLRLADALCHLPDDTLAAVVLKHCRGWTLAAIADHLGRTPAAVASPCAAA